ncbi:MAG: hypothetical protein IPP80_10450 [Ignavibacteria bacterium]|nr:hypothetical protein [Ignavibacteria bacterium]
MRSTLTTLSSSVNDVGSRSAFPLSEEDLSEDEGLATFTLPVNVPASETNFS